MSVRQGRFAKSSENVASLPSIDPQSSPSDVPRPSRLSFSRSSLVKIVFILLIIVGSLILSLDYIIADAEMRRNLLESQLSTCREREDRVWNLGYEAGEKLGMYRVSIVGREGDSEAWAAWKEGFKAGEELGKRGVCERYRF